MVSHLLSGRVWGIKWRQKHQAALYKLSHRKTLSHPFVLDPGAPLTIFDVYRLAMLCPISAYKFTFCSLSGVFVSGSKFLLFVGDKDTIIMDYDLNLN